MIMWVWFFAWLSLFWIAYECCGLYAASSIMIYDKSYESDYSVWTFDVDFFGVFLALWSA